MKKLASLLLALSLIFGLASFSYAEEPYEVVIETVTFGAEYADIPAIEEAINAITVPAINVSVKILNVGIPEHAQKISMMIAGGEKIDLVMAGLTMPMVNMAVDGMLLPLDELLASQGADIQALFGDKLEAGKVNGTLYAIPADAYPAQSGGFIYNKQMADELGITVPNPVTVDQLAEIFADIQAQKPQIYGTCFGNGETSNVLYDYNLENYGSAMYAYGVTLNQYENTDIVNLFATEQFREYALRHKDWVDKGYVPNDSMTSGILANEYIASGTVFGMTTNYSPLEAPTQQANYTFPIGMAEITKPVNSTSGLQERMWGIPVTCENPEKAMAFLNLMFANAEVANLLSNGIEGLNYQFSGEGIVTYADGVDPAAPGYARIFSRFGDQMKVYQWEPATPEIYEELAAFNENAMNSLTLGYSFNSENVATEVAAVTTVITQYLPALECGMVDDVDAAIATLNEELEKAGLSRIIEENQRQLNEWMANQ